MAPRRSRVRTVNCGTSYAGHRALQREWFGPAFLRQVRDAVVRRRRAHPQHRPHGVPPDRLGRPPLLEGVFRHLEAALERNMEYSELCLRQVTVRILVSVF